MSEWVSVKDRLPGVLEKVLVIDEGAYMTLAALRIGRGFIDQYDNVFETVEYWMPLPKLPK